MNVTFDYQLSRFGARHGFVTERLTEPGLAPKRLAHRDNSMNAAPEEAAFQQDMINQMVAGGWKLGDPAKYDRKLTLYTEDCSPVVTMELKSEFKQDIENAKKQYRKTRLHKDPETSKPEPLLALKRGALVHFAVSQHEAWMTTRLHGDETRFTAVSI